MRLLPCLNAFNDLVSRTNPNSLECYVETIIALSFLNTHFILSSCWAICRSPPTQPWNIEQTISLNLECHMPPSSFFLLIPVLSFFHLTLIRPGGELGLNRKQWWRWRWPWLHGIHGLAWLLSLPSRREVSKAGLAAPVISKYRE